jgi:hypothetical protein
MKRLHWRALMFGLALLVGSAAPVRAQDGDRDVIDAGQLQDRLSGPTIDRLNRIARTAQENGVPPQLIRQKINEGVSKGVRGQRLENAIADYARRLVAARNLLGSGAQPAVLDAAAEATARGVPPARIRVFAGDNRDQRRVVVGLRVIAELRESGVPTDPAVRAVQSAIDRGVTGERLFALSAAVRRRVRQGESPTSALREIAGAARPGVRSVPGRDGTGDTPTRDRPRQRPRDQGSRDRG